jgi:hypothetical protein
MRSTAGECAAQRGECATQRGECALLDQAAITPQAFTL